MRGPWSRIAILGETSGTALFVALTLFAARSVGAEGTACANPTVIVPDGRVTSSSVPAGATFYFSISSRIGSSYSAEFHNVLGAAVQVPGALSLYSDSGCAAVISPTGTSGIDPGDQNGARVSFTAPSTQTRFALNNTSGSPITYSFTVSDTTMFSPAWTTNGSYDTFYSFLNTTNAPLNGTVTLYNAGGTPVSTAGVTVNPNSTASVNTLGLGVPRSQTGTAQFTHNGPPGAILAEAAIANFTFSPTPYIQSVKFVPVRSGDAALGGVGVGVVGTAQLSDGAVTGTKIANGAVVRSLNGQTDIVTLGTANGLGVAAGGGTVTVSSNGTPSNVGGTLAMRDPSGNLSAQTVTLSGNLALPNTGASVGAITLGGPPFLHNFGVDNTFVGALAGNTSLTGPSNTGVGFRALNRDTTGSSNAAFGWEALAFNTTGSSNAAFGREALLANTTGSNNAAFGTGALLLNTTGVNNAAFGFSALDSNRTGGYNAAFGDEALQSNVSGQSNAAFGTYALYSNTTAMFNAAFGTDALFSSTTGSSNAAFGSLALYGLTSGGSNTAIGAFAGINLASGNSNIYIGSPGMVSESQTIRVGSTQTAAFMAGISGATSASGVAVFVNSSGQLGTTTSSRRFKDEIADMDRDSDVLMKLRPVAFYYKPEYDDTRTRQYGLVAEEVAQVAPELVLSDKDGAPQTVRYHFVNAMLLNEVQKQRRRAEEQAKANEAQRSTIARQEAEIRDLAARIERLEAALAR